MKRSDNGRQIRRLYDFIRLLRLFEVGSLKRFPEPWSAGGKYIVHVPLVLETDISI